MRTTISPIPCQHIADYYRRRWEHQKCIAFKLLMLGYHQCSIGEIEPGINNLFA